MGTNYYVVKKIDEDKFIDDIRDITKNSSQLNLKTNIDDYIDDTYPTVHIGKSSGGWKFLFNHNNEKYYKKTVESIDEFIRNNTIYDEYGELINPDEFWNLVDSKQNLLDNKEYYETIGKVYSNNFMESYYEEYFDGLRFSTSTEFS